MLDRIDPVFDWLGLVACVVMLAAYELGLRRRARRRPDQVARVMHARLRAQWVEALATQPGTELLAVQTVRNSLMSATIIASTWALGLMGGLSLMGKVELAIAADGAPAPELVVLGLLFAMLFASLVLAVVAVRFFNHAGFMISIPTSSPLRSSTTAQAAAYLGRAGQLYSLSLRSFFFVAPLVVGLLSPALMPLAAVATLAALAAFDHVPTGKTMA